MMKFLILAGAVLAFATPVSLPAKAGTSVGIAIGEPYPGYDPYSGHHPYPAPDDDEEDEDEDDQITCWEGKQILRERRYRQIRPVKCSGTIFRYRALKRNRIWSVRVNSYSGNIVGARPIGDY